VLNRLNFPKIAAWLTAFAPLLLSGRALAADPPLQGCSGSNCLADPNVLNIPTISLGTGATAIVNVLTFIAVITATIFLLIGGIRFTTSSGNPSNISGARNQITYAIMGLVIAILARLIVGFILANSPQ
jgi:hypothetical protein